MSAGYAFRFDAAFCSGCKACQAACKDKNNLPEGVLWRRVYEVTGGEWQQQGSAWTNSVFAYNLSLACNHCVHPKCAGVCPVDAYTVRPDGIVLLDSSKCIGCGYCAWACPYGAPQYDRQVGRMTKCNFCFDNIDAGLPPACAAACPLRVLDCESLESPAAVPAGYAALWELPASQHPYPLASFSRTEPHLSIRPHPAMGTPLPKTIANREEVQPQSRTGWEEAPLVTFTLLAQMAVGGFWAMLWSFTPLWLLVEYDATPLRLLPLLMVTACLGLAALASFSHLGSKRNAWRAAGHLRKSWLSREILSVMLFGAALVALVCLHLFSRPIPPILLWAAALLGLVLLHSMSQVYHLRAVPAWNTWRTNASFLLTALLLGLALMASLLAWESHWTGIQLSSLQWHQAGFVILGLLVVRGILGNRRSPYHRIHSLWLGLLYAAAMLALDVFFAPGPAPAAAAFLLLGLIFAEEAVGRWLFYEARVSDTLTWQPSDPLA